MKLCKIICIISATIIFISMFTVSVSASEVQRITVLGDSIAEGYALLENEKNYGEWLGEYFKAEVDNFAIFGKTTSQLMEDIKHKSEVSDSINKADLICVSIGANDILSIIFDDLVAIGKSYNSSSQSLDISSGTIQKLLISFSSSLGPAATQAAENIGILREMLAEMNPNARVIFQTVYNPFETNDPSMESIALPLYTFSSIYLSSINNAIKNGELTEFADIQNKFRGHCTTFTNIDDFDIHPNESGHFIIAEEIVQKLKIKGNGNVFRNGLKSFSVDNETFPNELKKEIIQLSYGRFRTEELIASAEINNKTTEVTEITTETVTKVSTSEKNQDVKNNIKKEYTTIIFLSVITVVIVAVASYILIKINKKTGA